MGSERSLGSHYLALLSGDLARKICKLGGTIWFCGLVCSQLSFGGYGLVWRKFRAGSRPSFLRVFHRWDTVCGGFCWNSASLCPVCDRVPFSGEDSWIVLTEEEGESLKVSLSSGFGSCFGPVQSTVP